ncbi:LysM peptidoglycan-binding domain-containing protein [Roseobacter sinensis]|uniref:LysM peptidoglycan-binding domain-containing protein n=1 Tax=Roseobacter sinensis TaxID=2931391 RepID=A0ABT3BGS9_9RHOB|nr:Ig-like domain-containing protein [Roseobacter sp. WL0113]MCV3272589.1 LysM peptidoglycan-binding domain-containing protein [Roseobacter sp. WL0113]
MSDARADTKPGGTGLWLAGAVVIGVIGAGVYIMFDRDEAAGPDDLAALEEPSSDSATPEADAPVQQEASAAEAEREEATPAAPPEPAPQTPPTVDEVRLEADGLTVIAGRAEPGAQVSVRVDGEEVATAVADARGAFAAVGVVAPSDAVRVLTLEAQGADGAVASEEDVILAPLAPQVADAAPVQGDTAPDADAPKRATQEAVETAEPSPAGDEREVAALAPAASGAGPSAAPVPDAEALDPTAGQAAALADPPVTTTAEAATSAPDPGSVAVLKSTEEGVELLQPAPEAMTAVAIDTISYSDAGEVQLSGRAVAGTSEVRVYLNNSFATSLPVDSDGGWRGDLPQVDAGIYQLRVDEVNAAGVVTSRIETPFKREAPAALAEADTERAGPVRAITVQTGDTLWAIARDRYGEGVLYVKVFEANRTAIRDPDLIYPGQVFDLPVE